MNMGDRAHSDNMYCHFPPQTLYILVAVHLKIRWVIVPDCVIDVTRSIKTLRLTINFNWDKIAL